MKKKTKSKLSFGLKERKPRSHCSTVLPCNGCNTIKMLLVGIKLLQMMNIQRSSSSSIDDIVVGKKVFHCMDFVTSLPVLSLWGDEESANHDAISQDRQNVFKIHLNSIS